MRAVERCVINEHVGEKVKLCAKFHTLHFFLFSIMFVVGLSANGKKIPEVIVQLDKRVTRKMLFPFR